MSDKAKRARNRRKSAQASAAHHTLTEGYNPRRMLSFKQWCALNDLSPDVGRRIINGLTDTPPPKVTQVSDRRIGIRWDHNIEWQDARVRAEPKVPPRSRKVVSQIAAE